MIDLCMFCLNNCSTYIKLEYCSCKTVTHEECFENYLDNNIIIKCIICREIYNYNNFNKSYKKIIENIINNWSFIDSCFYSIFFILQNIYFYIDTKLFYNSDGILRALFAVIYHAFLLLLTFFPYLLIVHIKYIFKIIININICNKKVYKVYNL